MRISNLILAAALLFAAAVPGHAEPYLAIFKGMHCSACHNDPGGGGKRSVYGNAFAQTELVASRAGDPQSAFWTGDINRWFGVGANLRTEYRYIDTPNEPEISEFDVSRGTVYLEANIVPNRLQIYVDQQFAPSGSLNREAYVRVRSTDAKWHLAAGQFYLPFGLRLQDDSAFVRQATGINFTNPDRGLLIGYESGAWSTLLSLSNGTGGASETDRGKQVSFLSAFVQPRWRVGLSLNSNDADAGDRDMGGLFAGLRTGSLLWLGEVDWIRDEIPSGPNVDALAGLFEVNWMYRKGHNVKFSYDYLDPDRDISEDHQVRWSGVYEYAPLQFLQARLGIRMYDGIPQVDRQNRDELFLELHGFF
ncbi:MAG: hypothetical protein ACR2RD_00585 [Woeseiaceae bacterium]